MDIKNSKILILDFGSQYTQLIARRVRELDVYCEIYAWDADTAAIEAFDPQGIILSGGPESVHMKNAPTLNEVVLTLNIPVLGVCYGMQLLNQYYGGVVEGSEEKEFGYAKVHLTGKSDLFSQIDKDELDVWMSHGDKIQSLAPNFHAIAHTSSTPYAACEHKELPVFGVQFHPEVEHTADGRELLSQFVHGICGCEKLWKTDNIIDTHVDSIRELVGDEKVLLGLSGGVDSSVVDALLHKASGKQLVCVFVDTR